MKLRIELSGGLELLFGKVKRHDVDVPTSVVTMAHLIRWMRDNLLCDRPELFVAGDTVRPGILVLVNDTDWELEGTLEYRLAEGDAIAFISTLHGG